MVENEKKMYTLMLDINN